jgi:hypothetical protein
MIKRVYGARDYEGRFASWPRVPSERRPPGPALWMETMFLVAGLAVAGLVGIAAAFYFSIRSGNRGDKRLRSARPGLSRPDLSSPRRTTDDGTPVTTFTPAASARPRRPRAARTAEPAGARRLADTQALPEDPWPGDAEAGNPWPDDAWPDDPMSGDPTATDPRLGTAPFDAGETRPIATTAAVKPRRRKGFRKGADLDEELWPAESFGGVSDEQFWDDLASDKPLATTARTAQQEPPSRSRLSGPPAGAGLITGSTAGPAAGLDNGPATGPQAVQAVQAPAGDRKRDERGPGGGRRGRYPAPRTASDPTAERTAIQPSYAATQPVQGMKPPLPGATQPVRAAATPPRGTAAQPREAVTPPRGTAAQPREAATPPRGTAAQPRGTGTQPVETRRRRPSSAEEDPLTSAAFSLRPSGPVDGRSSLRARNASADRFDTGTSAYPYSAPSYGNGSPAAPAGEPRRRSGNGSHARPEDTGDATRPARQAYPRGSHQATGSYPATGSYRSNGGYPGNGYPGNGYQGNGHRGNGHRAPYDPRDDYQRLTHQL